METGKFEDYAAARIPQLRDQAQALSAEADALEKALKAFHASRRANGTLAVTLDDTTVVATGKGGRQVQPGSQSHTILNLLDTAAASGRSLTEMYALLAEKGITNAGSVRSVVWNLKKTGRAVVRGDRYYSPAHAPR